MLDKFASELTYKLLAATGILLILLLPYASWQYAKNLEQEVLPILQQQILVDLDLQSLKNQFDSLSTAIKSTESNNPDAVEYTVSELANLYAESESISAQIETLYMHKAEIQLSKHLLIKRAKWVFFVVVGSLMVAAVMTVLGCLGWFFHVRIYEERRGVPRN